MLAHRLLHSSSLFGRLLSMFSARTGTGTVQLYFCLIHLNYRSFTLLLSSDCSFLSAIGLLEYWYRWRLDQRIRKLLDFSYRIKVTNWLSDIRFNKISKAGHCRTNPWPAVTDWPWCRNADTGLTHLTTGKYSDARLTLFPAFRHLLIPSEVFWFFPLIACLTSWKTSMRCRADDTTLPALPTVRQSYNHKTMSYASPNELCCT